MPRGVRSVPVPTEPDLQLQALSEYTQATRTYLLTCRDWQKAKERLGELEVQKAAMEKAMLAARERLDAQLRSAVEVQVASETQVVNNGLAA